MAVAGSTSRVDECRIVSELDRWLAAYRSGFAIGIDPTSMIQRARDEVQALCVERDAWKHKVWSDRSKLGHRVAKTRADALEEAAALCERMPGDDEAAYRFAAKAIRALLKDGP